MNDFAMKSVTIAGKEFMLRAPYGEGETVLTEGEAHALNQTRNENVRNALAKKVKEWTGSPEDLAAEVDKYDAEYEFGVRRAGGGGVSRDPITTEARALARAAIKAQLKSQNISATAEAINEAIDRLLASDAGTQFRELAEKRVAERQAAAAAVMDQVSGFLPPAA